jgi:hypothetical protein
VSELPFYKDWQFYVAAYGAVIGTIAFVEQTFFKSPQFSLQVRFRRRKNGNGELDVWARNKGTEAVGIYRPIARFLDGQKKTIHTRTLAEWIDGQLDEPDEWMFETEDPIDLKPMSTRYFTVALSPYAQVSDVWIVDSVGRRKRKYVGAGRFRRWWWKLRRYRRPPLR